MNPFAIFDNFVEAFFGKTDRDRIAWRTATFADRELESNYLDYLVDQELPKERFLNLLGVGIYCIFGILDAFTFRENLTDVLIVRWALCTPLAVTIILLTFYEPFKRNFQFITAASMLIGSLSMVWMISVMPHGGPPYIIGILAIFIFFSCMTRLYFLCAAGVFISVLSVYAVTILYISPKSTMEISSGLFFMVTIATFSFATSYTQEVRSRLLFHRTRQRELDAAYIEELLIEATAADQSKINFLSVLSHELRTPLHQIIGFCEVVMNPAASKEDAQKFLEQIHTSAHSLLSRLAKMLRYADATAGKIKYEFEYCSVKELVETITAQANDKAEDKNVDISIDTLEPAELYIDTLNASYAIGHIVENAINASTQGSNIVIRGCKDENGDYILEIEDYGVGMEPEKIKAALAPFVQVQAFRTRSTEGVGLGLTLARKILNDQQAEITLESTPGEGTRASVRFSAQSQAPVEAETRSAA